MGKKVNHKNFFFEDDEDNLHGVKPRVSNSAILVSSDDDDANEDLSLKIVEKALLLRAAKLVPDSDGNSDGSGNGAINLDEKEATAGTSGSKKITKKKKKRKVKKLELGENNVVVTEEKTETIGTIDQVDSVEPKTTDITDNIVFRKLLRGPRYFDPPDSRGACFNCGEEGHNAVNCTSVKRKKPCFVCGSLGHNAKNCSKAQNCYNCKKSGHRAKDCPEKHRDASLSSKICLKCGDSGHEMFSCQNHYSDDDLKNIQCYICKKFGHLCCVNSTGNTPIEVSCYKCGQIGHTGLACSRLRVEASSAASPSSCYKCGEEGHFARECTSSIKASSRLCDEASPAASPSSCYKCGGEGHYARECTSSTKGGKRNRDLSNSKLGSQIEEVYHLGSKSAPHDFAKGHKKKKPNYDEQFTTTLPRKSGHKGRWMMEEKPYYDEQFTPLPRKSGHKDRWMMEEDPGNFYNGMSMNNNWNSPITPPGCYNYSEYAGRYASPRSSARMHTLHPGTPMLGPSNAYHNRFSAPHSGTPVSGYHNRFSASRFGDFSNDGRRRNYRW